MQKNSTSNKPSQTGFDDYGTSYANIDEMWKKELENPDNGDVKNPIGSKDNWYNKAAEYWEKTDATLDGVLGGFGILNDPDIKSSIKFLTYLFEKKMIKKGRAIDCGAGIGRVSKELLCHIFEEVDLIDQNPKYVEEAKNVLKDCPNMKDFYAEGLQTFQFKKQYDVIWVQWVSSHLTDEDYIDFLKRCADSLTETGIVVVKENLAKSGFIVHKDDYSVTRSDDLFRKLFARADLQIVHQAFQEDFPEGMFQVNQYALRKKGH